MLKGIAFLLVSVVIVSLAGGAFAATINIPNPLCLRDSSGQPIDPDHCIETIPALIEQIASYITTAIAALAGLMFVISGIFFVTSAGSPEKINKARQMAIYAIIGTAIALGGAGLVAVITAVIGGTS